MSFLKRFWNNLTGTEEIKVRARTKKGKFIADDKSTPDAVSYTHLTLPTIYSV